MCSHEQHSEHMDALARIEKHLFTLVSGRAFIDQAYLVDDTQGFNLDYKNRRHVYAFSANTILLNLGDLGIVSIPQNTWTCIDYREGFQVFTSGQSSPVPVVIRATDERIA